MPESSLSDRGGGISHDQGRLEALLEASRLLHGSLDLDQLLAHLLRSVMGRLLVRRGLVALCRKDGTSIVRIARGLRQVTTGEIFEPIRAGEMGLQVVLRIGDPARPVGYLALSDAATEFSSVEGGFLDGLLGLAASAIGNAAAHDESRHLNEELDRRLHELEALLDLSRAFAATLTPSEVLHLLTLTLAGRWAIPRYAARVWRDGKPSVARERNMQVTPDLATRLAADLTVATVVAKLPSADLRSTLEAVGAGTVIPIRSRDTSLGLVLLSAPLGERDLGGPDLRFADSVAAQATVALETAWLFEETVEKRKMEAELNLAASIQSRLFPSRLPSLHGCDIAARNRPARQVGGDYYDVVAIDGSGPDRRHLLCVADVSGKGTGAAILMSNFQATLRALAGSGIDLPALTSRMNDLLYATTAANKYVTATLVELEPVTGSCRAVNAGHVDGFVARAGGSVERLSAGGTPIGLLPDRTYSDVRFDLAPGDVLFLYSDGVVDANDGDENELGEDTLLDALVAVRGESAAAIVDQVFSTVDRHVGTTPQFDDITLLAVKRVAT